MSVSATLAAVQISRRNLLAISAVGATAATLAANAVMAEEATADISKLPRVKQKLVPPPGLPEHEQVASTGPKVVEVELVIEEKKVVIDGDGTEIWVFAYNGTVPGPLIVCHEGDYVELTMKNLPSNTMEHNIDFHSSTGALGGGALTKILPGEEVVLRWKAIKPGVFIYHCAPGDVMIPYHVVHGMNGAVMVLPRDGLKDREGKALKYDRAYFIGEQDFYVPQNEDGTYKKYETAGEDLPESLDVMRKLIPTHVVFNGKVGALTGQDAMTAKVGENVLFIHAQANRDSRPHLIGGHLENSAIHRKSVWKHGSSLVAVLAPPSTNFASLASTLTSTTT
jgi:nitrite reductase (NO-forming)